MESFNPLRDRAYLDDLDQFWDDLVAEAPVTPLQLGRSDTATIRWLQGAQSSPGPDPDFVARLRTDLFTSTPRLQPALPVAGPNVQREAAVDRIGRHSLWHGERERSQNWFTTYVLTAALVLLTIGAVYSLLGRERVDPATEYRPMLGGSAARTGVLPGPGPVSSPVVRWRFQTANLVLTTAAVVDDLVFVGATDNYLYAIDVNTGGERWHFRAETGISSSPAVIDGTVYVGAGGPESSRGAVYALDVETGRQRWRFEAGAIRSSPAVVGGVVYVGSDDGYLYALNSATGSVQWRVATGGPVVSSPAVADNDVFVGSGDGNLYAVAADSGRQRWMAPLDAAVVGTPAVSGGLLFVVSDAGSLYAIDAKSSETRWKVDGGGQPGSAVAVSGGLVYSTTGDTLQARDIATGEPRWSFRFGKGNYSLGSPVIADGVVYFGSQSYAGTISSGLASSGLLFAIDAKDGAERWHIEVGQIWLAPPAIVDGVAYIGTAEGEVVAVSDPARTIRAPT